jgi:hypothetical protein
MPVDPAILDSGVFGLGRRARAGLRLLRNELRAGRCVGLGLAQRLGCVRRGFTSTSAALYGLDGPPDPGAYVSEWHEGALGKRPNRRHGAMFDDKLSFHYTMKGLSPRTIPVLGVVDDGRFVPIDAADGERPAEAFLREVDGPVVLKPNFGTHGDGVIFLERAADGGLAVRDGSLTPTTPEAVSQRIAGTEYVAQPRIEQAAYARDIFPEATNTVRVMTMLEVDTGRPFVPICVHRFGTARTAPIDAFAKGGLAAEVGLEDGVLGPLVAMPEDGRRVVLEAHPDTGAVVTGRRVPHWRAVLDHLVEVAGRLPFLRYVGWDVIVTDDGFYVNEGNVQPSLKLLQACRPILRDERVERFFRHHAVI